MAIDATTATLTAAIASPVVAALASLFVARIGVAADLRQVEYHLKRAELIEKLLSIQSNRKVAIKLPVKMLVEELNDIAASTCQTSDRLNGQKLAAYYNSPLWKRLMVLPRPRSIGGWIASGIYYLYAFSAIFYLVVGAVVEPERELGEPFPGSTILLVSAGSAVLAWLGRLWALHSARKNLPHEDAAGASAGRQ